MRINQSIFWICDSLGKINWVNDGQLIHYVPWIGNVILGSFHKHGHNLYAVHEDPGNKCNTKQNSVCYGVLTHKQASQKWEHEQAREQSYLPVKERCCFIIENVIDS